MVLLSLLTAKSRAAEHTTANADTIHPASSTPGRAAAGPVADVAGTAGTVPGTGQITVVLGREGLGAATLIVAREGRHFSRAGLQVRLDVAPDDEAAERAVADGHADFGAVQLSAGFLAYAATHELRIIAPEYADRTGFPSTALLVSLAARASGLRSPADLAHRRIGLLSPDMPARFALVQSAAHYGVSAATLQLTSATNQTQLQAEIAAGALDAAVLPYATALAWRKKTPGLSIIRLSDSVQWQDGVIFARSATLRNQTAEAATFMRAYRAAVADYDLTFQQRDDGGTALPGTHFGMYLTAIAAQTGFKVADAAYALPFCDKLARLDPDDIGRQLAFWQALGLVGKQVTVAAIVDASLNPEHFSKM